MFIRKRQPSFGLNTTSTADISFVLLIFFLVTTSMDRDKGLMRQLPPLSQDEQPAVEVDKGKVLTLSITAAGRLLADGVPVDMSRVVETVERFAGSRGREHIIVLEISTDADYDVYFRLQNHLSAAYRHLRDRAARRLYKKTYGECSEAEREEVRRVCPQRVVEKYQEEGGLQP